jgi:hypothetical protein
MSDGRVGKKLNYKSVTLQTNGSELHQHEDGEKWIILRFLKVEMIGIGDGLMQVRKEEV